ncbi:hypothetical protein HUT00_15710 [Pseudomonas chlororaphis]|nr:hypothetical protein [Pseudomonas chlororaphis]
MAGTAVVGMTTASLIPGVDVNAVVGAFAGAMFFVVFAFLHMSSCEVYTAPNTRPSRW